MLLIRATQFNVLLSLATFLNGDSPCQIAGFSKIVVWIQSVVDLIRTHFEDKYADLNGEIPASIPVYPVPSHEEPRFSCFGEAEAGGVSSAHFSGQMCVHINYGLRLLYFSLQLL